MVDLTKAPDAHTRRLEEIEAHTAKAIETAGKEFEERLMRNFAKAFQKHWDASWASRDEEKGREAERDATRARIKKEIDEEMSRRGYRDQNSNLMEVFELKAWFDDQFNRAVLQFLALTILLGLFAIPKYASSFFWHFLFAFAIGVTALYTRREIYKSGIRECRKAPFKTGDDKFGYYAFGTIAAAVPMILAIAYVALMERAYVEKDTSALLNYTFEELEGVRYTETAFNEKGNWRTAITVRAPFPSQMKAFREQVAVACFPREAEAELKPGRILTYEEGTDFPQQLGGSVPSSICEKILMLYEKHGSTEPVTNVIHLPFHPEPQE